MWSGAGAALASWLPWVTKAGGAAGDSATEGSGGLTGVAASLAPICVPCDTLRLEPRSLCELPHRFTDLYSRLSHHRCVTTKAFPEEPAICMTCGELLCAGSQCCKRNGVGALTRHVASCGAGCGLFFLVHRCGTVLIRGPHAAYSISPYVDEHGEEDSGLRRGRPLHLDADRMRQLGRLWASHAVAGEVVRERVLRERVIREGYF